MDELMNVKEAAAYLRLNYMTVYKLAQKRMLPAFKVGGNWRFKKEILDEWMGKKSSATRGSVLIVDDDPMILEILNEIILNQGFSSVLAADGVSALAEIDRQHFDLIFLDLLLPGASGIDILEAVKNKNKDILVVIITAYADEPVTLKAMSLGPLMLVRKPFREKDILEVLNIIMRGRLV